MHINGNKENIDKTTWESFCSNAKEKTFTHSYSWGIFNEKMGDKVWRLGYLMIMPYKLFF
jgi:hypothetical protein